MHDSKAMPDRVMIKEDKNGRMYSPVTNLAGCFRQYLTLDGEQLVSLDITACQPFLLAVLLDKLVDALDQAQWVGNIEALSDAHRTIAARLGMEKGASGLFWTYLKKRYDR